MKNTFFILLVITVSIGSQLQAAGVNSNRNFYLEAFNYNISKLCKVDHLQLKEEIVVDAQLMGNNYNEVVVLWENSEDICATREIRNFVCNGILQ